MRNKNIGLMLAAISLLVLTIAYMLIRNMPLSRMPVLVWVLFAAAILLPMIKALQEHKKSK